MQWRRQGGALGARAPPEAIAIRPRLLTVHHILPEDSADLEHPPDL